MADRASEYEGRTEAERTSRIRGGGPAAPAERDVERRTRTEPRSTARSASTEPRTASSEVYRYEPDGRERGALRAGGSSRTDAQKAAIGMGAASAAIGALGLFAPVVTGNDDRIINRHNGKLLGIFAVNPPHAMVHLGLGIAGLIAGRSDRASRRYLETSGMAYATLATAGFIKGRDREGIYEVFGLALNTADNWLHTVWGGAAGIVAARGERRARGGAIEESEPRRRAA